MANIAANQPDQSRRAKKSTKKTTSTKKKTTKKSSTTNKSVSYAGKPDGTYKEIVKSDNQNYTDNTKYDRNSYHEDMRYFGKKLQNTYDFPTQKSNYLSITSNKLDSFIGTYNKEKKKYYKDSFDPALYNFNMSYNSETLAMVDKARQSVNLPFNGFGNTQSSHFSIITSLYNRFKIPNPNEYLGKSFSHVFLTRPDCNLLTSKGKMSDNISDSQLYMYVYNTAPELLQSLCHDGQKSTNPNNHFMMFLSNQASSFSLSDEYINKDTYGKTWIGDKIAYGKHDVESKAAGDFNISYTDDKRLHVYQLHRLWVEYISNVYTGLFNPKLEYQKNRIMDYACSVYYIMTDESGENIIFWSKYYGVFPTTIPSTQYSWGKGNALNSPDIEISYQFSFKEDYNPLSLIEFNEDACINTNDGAASIKYEPTFDESIGSCGTTYVGTPFIQTKIDSRGELHYLLRFMPRKKN